MVESVQPGASFRRRPSLRIEADLGRPIAKLAGPVVLAMLTQTAINLADTIMVGYLPKHQSITGQSAIGYSLMVIWTVGGFLSALGIGTQALVARRNGEKNRQAAGAVLTNSALLAIVSSIVATFVIWEPMDDLFRLLSPSEDVVAVGTSYCQLRMVALVSMVLTMTYKAFFDGLGRTRVHMGAAIVMNFLNLILNYVFIFGAGPVPMMGVDGAAIASTISSYIGLFIMIGWGLRGSYRRRYRYLSASKLSSGVCWDILRLSVPSGLATMAMMSGFALFFMVMGMLDSGAVYEVLARVLPGAGVPAELAAAPPDLYTAAFTARPPVFTAAAKVIIDTMSVVFMAAIALGTATATLVSHHLGRREPELAERYGFAAIKLGVYVTLGLGVALFVFPDEVLTVFSKDSEVVSAARGTMQMMATGNAVIVAGLVASYALFGAGNTKYVMAVQATFHFLCLVPLAWVLGVVLELGIPGAFGAVLVYAFLSSTLLIRKFYLGEWKEIRI